MRKNISGNIAKAVLAVSVILLAVVSGCTTLYGDDFIYGTYFLSGFSEFLKMTYNHYMEMNGRVIVHFLLEVILFFKDSLFFAVIPIMVISVFWLYLKICGNKIGKVEFLTLSISGVMCLSVSILREGMFWLAGAMNYIFPLILAFTAFYIQKKAVDNGAAGPAYFLLMFICGASTEQCGAMAVAMCVLYLVSKKIQGEKIPISVWLLPVFTVLGFLTVVLSPGTSGRTVQETVYEAVPVLKRIQDMYYIALAGGGAAWIFELTLALFAIRTFDRLKAVSVLTIIGVIVSSLLCIFGHYVIGGVIITVLYLFIGFVCYFRGILIEQSIILLTALLSVGMLMLSTTFGYRNIMPCVLSLICVSADIICGYLMRLKTYVKTVTITIVFVVAAVVFSPVLSGYVQNRKIINENLSAISNDGEGFYYNADIETEYGYIQFITDKYYREGFREIYEVKPETKIFVVGEDFEDLYINGEHCENPIYISGNKKYYPLRNVISAYGGSVIYDENNRQTKITVEDITVYYDQERARFLDGTDVSEYLLTDRKYGRMFESILYFEDSVFEKVFSLEL